VNTNPYEPTRAPLLEQRESGVRWGKALAVWWSAAWRGALYATPGGFVLGTLVDVVARLTDVPDNKAQIYAAVGGYLVSIPLSMLALKHALSKHLSSLVAEQSGMSPNTSLERTREG
jgi:hypothetical protein